MRVAPVGTAVFDTTVGVSQGNPPSGEIGRHALALGTFTTVEGAGLSACGPTAAGGLTAAFCGAAVTFAASVSYGLVLAGVDPDEMAEVVDCMNPYGRSEHWASFLAPG